MRNFVILVLTTLTFLSGCDFKPDLSTGPNPFTFPITWVSASGTVVDEVSNKPVSQASVTVGAREIVWLATFFERPFFDCPEGVAVDANSQFSVYRTGQHATYKLFVEGDPDAPADQLYGKSEIELAKNVEHRSLVVRLPRLSRLILILETVNAFGEGDFVQWRIDDAFGRSHVGRTTAPELRHERAHNLRGQSAVILWTVSRDGVREDYSDTLSTPALTETRYTINY